MQKLALQDGHHRGMALQAWQRWREGRDNGIADADGRTANEDDFVA